MNAEVQAESLEQIGSKLRASYVRFVVSWAVAEPEQGVYDETYLAGVDRAVALAKANGMKVMITFAYVPRWASDSAYWYNNPFAEKGYDRRYAMKTDATTLAAFQEFAGRWRLGSTSGVSSAGTSPICTSRSTPEHGQGQGHRRPHLRQDAAEVLGRHP